MIAEQRDAWGWTITFLGTDQDAIAEAGRLGIAQGQALYFTKNAGGLRGMGAALANTVAHASSGSAGSYSYSDADRAGALADDDDESTTTKGGN